MPFDENNLYGVAYGVDRRGRHRTFESALDAAFASLTVERNDFFDQVVNAWDGLFPDLRAKPGRYEAGRIYLYVRSAPMSFAVRPKLRMIARRLAELPNAPKKIDLRVEIHTQ